MSTAAVSSGSLSSLQQYFQTRQTDLKQLGQALTSGDLAGAQAAFDSIVKLGARGPFAKGNPFVVKHREQDFAAIGQALQAGDLASAQRAFADLKATVQNGGNRFPATPNAPLPEVLPSSTGAEIVLNLNRLNLNSGSDGASGKITIDISNQAGGGEQVSVRHGDKGSNAQAVTFNLPPNSDEEIVLNLPGPSAVNDATTGGSSTTTPTGSTSTNGSSVRGLNVSA